MGDNHGPNRFTNYIETHEAIMGQFVDRGFVLSNTLTLAPYGAGYLTMFGKITCLGGITVEVTKILQVVDGDGPTAQVQTIEYHYNAHVVGKGNVLRYDSPHSDHNQFHHVHRYRVFDGDGAGTVEACAWPTLGEVLSELEFWFYENYELLH